MLLRRTEQHEHRKRAPEQHHVDHMQADKEQHHVSGELVQLPEPTLVLAIVLLARSLVATAFAGIADIRKSARGTTTVLASTTTSGDFVRSSAMPVPVTSRRHTPTPPRSTRAMAGSLAVGIRRRLARPGRNRPRRNWVGPNIPQARRKRIMPATM